MNVCTKAGTATSQSSQLAPNSIRETLQPATLEAFSHSLQLKAEGGVGDCSHKPLTACISAGRHVLNCGDAKWVGCDLVQELHGYAIPARGAGCCGGVGLPLCPELPCPGGAGALGCVTCPNVSLVAWWGHCMFQGVGGVGWQTETSQGRLEVGIPISAKSVPPTCNLP